MSKPVDPKLNFHYYPEEEIKEEIRRKKPDIDEEYCNFVANKVRFLSKELLARTENIESLPSLLVNQLAADIQKEWNIYRTQCVAHDSRRLEMEVKMSCARKTLSEPPPDLTITKFAVGGAAVGALEAGMSGGTAAAVGTQALKGATLAAAGGIISLVLDALFSPKPAY